LGKAGQAGSGGADADVMDKIATVCSEISHGNFEARIARITETGKLGEVQHKVNDLIDRCDAFVREATTCMEAVCRNVYYRTIMYGGLQGSFRVAAKIINNSVATQGKAVEKARQDADAEQARIVNTLAQGLRMLSDGDLTFRLTDFSKNTDKCATTSTAPWRRCTRRHRRFRPRRRKFRMRPPNFPPAPPIGHSEQRSRLQASNKPRPRIAATRLSLRLSKPWAGSSRPRARFLTSSA
jgi:hypothetical protein